MIGGEIKLSIDINFALTLGSSEAAHGSSTSQDTKEQEDMKGEAAVAASEPVREELVQSAVSFLSHPIVVASSDVQRRSFLENKGLTMDEIEEAFRRLLLVSFLLLTIYLTSILTGVCPWLFSDLVLFIDFAFVICRAHLQTLQVQMLANLKVYEESPFTSGLRRPPSLILV